MRSYGPITSWLHLAAGAAACAAVAVASGCGCGVVANPHASTGGSASALVLSDGTVQFNAITVGTSESFEIPVKDTANTSETITGAMVTGSGAASFKILSTFPISVPQGQNALVNVQFTPEAAGDVTASLVLETEMMGPSPIPLTGTGTGG